MAISREINAIGLAVLPHFAKRTIIYVQAFFHESLLIYRVFRIVNRQTLSNAQRVRGTILSE